MDQQVLKLVNDRSDRQDGMLKDIAASLKEHVDVDKRYWKEIDDLKAQGRLIKAIGGSSIATAVGAWLWHKFGG